MFRKYHVIHAIELNDHHLLAKAAEEHFQEEFTGNLRHWILDNGGKVTFTKITNDWSMNHIIHALVPDELLRIQLVPAKPANSHITFFNVEFVFEEGTLALCTTHNMYDSTHTWMLVNKLLTPIFLAELESKVMLFKERLFESGATAGIKALHDWLKEHNPLQFEGESGYKTDMYEFDGLLLMELGNKLLIAEQSALIADGKSPTVEYFDSVKRPRMGHLEELWRKKEFAFSHYCSAFQTSPTTGEIERNPMTAMSTAF